MPSRVVRAVAEAAGERREQHGGVCRGRPAEHDGHRWIEPGGREAVEDLAQPRLQAEVEHRVDACWEADDAGVHLGMQPAEECGERRLPVELQHTAVRSAHGRDRCVARIRAVEAQVQHSSDGRLLRLLHRDGRRRRRRGGGRTLGRRLESVVRGTIGSGALGRRPRYHGTVA